MKPLHMFAKTFFVNTIKKKKAIRHVTSYLGNSCDSSESNDFENSSDSDEEYIFFSTCTVTI